MNLLIVSECSKRALDESRRIIDQFAERKGERTWLASLTQDGLNTLRKRLRKTARRNTAVACHWIKSSGQSELLWIVGNLRRFNATGCVPTHTTERDILKQGDENRWNSVENIALLAALAGLFHDFGKANSLFQHMLKKKAKGFQPLRHEWLSLRLFCAWVNKRDDHTWLMALRDVRENHEAAMLAVLIKDDEDRSRPFESPFTALGPVAQTVAWLILSHHRLPVWLKGEHAPALSGAENWLTTQLTYSWNALNHECGWGARDWKKLWTFTSGTPLRSEIWRTKARKIAQRALNQPSLNSFSGLDDRFTCHMARAVLMLADHHYSAHEITPGWQDRQYSVYANTKSQHLNQQLDEHLIGVAQSALLLGRSLPHIRKTLPAITWHKGIKARSADERFRWQDKAFELAASLRTRSVDHGFFGVNMASTGCGKTLGNAKIMYALADEALGCRFSIALGLRTLTLQTGDALKEKLHLDESDLAVMIGSQAVKTLHHLGNASQLEEEDDLGSDTLSSLLPEHHYVRYDGSLDDGRLSRWLDEKSDLKALLSAPILVSTIDHLISATEGVRGGRQIAPMLRLLTSDLILDEPDDFDNNDNPALCRLVNWVGMCGARVLLSSATLPPSLVTSLFAAYRAGRAEWLKNEGRAGEGDAVICAWFDENNCVTENIAAGAAFIDAHQRFVERRRQQLENAPALRRGELLAVEVEQSTPYQAYASVIARAMHALHHRHHQRSPDGAKTVSLGVVRMANINALVAVAGHLLTLAPDANTRIHYCVYHSRHPMAMRSHIEKRLQAALTRHDENALFGVDEIAHALAKYPEQHHVFVVLASPVIEVGRDVDFDWAIVEPSSMRSIIQLAGRVQRHRQREPETPNVAILRKNINALRKQLYPYSRPGFENEKFSYTRHDMHDLLSPEEYEVITALPRIINTDHTVPPGPFSSFVALEHARLWFELQSKETTSAALWWRKPLTWNAELQRRKPFRLSAPQDAWFYSIEEHGSDAIFMQFNSETQEWKAAVKFEQPTLTLAEGVSIWIDTDYAQVYQALADSLGLEITQVGRTFGEVLLERYQDSADRRYFHPFLGVYRLVR